MSWQNVKNKECKHEDKLLSICRKLFWLFFLGGLVIYMILTVFTYVSSLPKIAADIFSVLWFMTTMALSLAYMYY